MNILITRPSPDGEELVSKLFHQGKFSYHLPLVSFSMNSSLSLLSKYLKYLSVGDFLFIVSRHAIQYADDYLKSIGISWPMTVKYYTVGRSTSLKLYELSGILSKYPKDCETSECLLKLPELIMPQYSFRQALILKGNNGRNILMNTLRERGIKVITCECYLRYPLVYDGEEQLRRMLYFDIKTVVITTGSMLIQLYYLIPMNYRKSWLLQCQLVVVSTRIAILANILGWDWKNIIVAQSSNNLTLIEILMQCTR